jgi:hypothetical protein
MTFGFASLLGEINNDDWMHAHSAWIAGTR